MEHHEILEHLEKLGNDFDKNIQTFFKEHGIEISLEDFNYKISTEHLNIREGFDRGKCHKNEDGQMECPKPPFGG